LIGGGTQGSKEVIVAGRREVEVAEFATVDGDNVGESHGDVGEIVSDDFLDFAAESFAFFLIGLYVNLVS